MSRAGDDRVERDGADGGAAEVEAAGRRVAADQLGEHRELAAGDLDAGVGGAAARPRAIASVARRVGLLDGEVVDHRDRLGADADEVVDVHRDAVDADGVQPAGLLGDDDLRADAVGRDRDAEVGADAQDARVVARAGRRRARARPVSIVRRTPTIAATAASDCVGVDAGGGVGVAHRVDRCSQTPPERHAGERRRGRPRTATARRRARPGRAAPRRASRRARRPSPSAKRPVIPGGSPRCASRTPLSTLAPAITGSATCRESALASGAREAARAHRRERHPAARDARHQRATPARAPSSSASATSPPRACAARARARRRASSRPTPSSRPTAIEPGVPRRRSIGRSSVQADDGGRDERAGEQRRRGGASRSRSGLGDLARAARSAARPRCRRAARPRRPCAGPASSSGYGQPSSQGTSVDVPGRGDGEQLRRAVEQAERERVPWRERAGGVRRRGHRRRRAPALAPAEEQPDDADDDRHDAPRSRSSAGRTRRSSQLSADLLAGERQARHPRDAAEDGEDA